MGQRLLLVMIAFLASIASWAALQTFLVVSEASDLGTERVVALLLLIPVTILIPASVIAGIAVASGWDWEPDVKMREPVD